MAVYSTGGVHIDKAISGKSKTGGQNPMKPEIKNVAKKTAAKKKATKKAK